MLQNLALEGQVSPFLLTGEEQNLLVTLISSVLVDTSTWRRSASFLAALDPRVAHRWTPSDTWALCGHQSGGHCS